jgi:hypothetical protein
MDPIGSGPTNHEQSTSIATTATAATATTATTATAPAKRIPNILFDKLPEVLVTVIVAEFLGDLKSIARLLTATNNQESRDILLRALKVAPVSNFDTEVSFGPACVAWLRQHCISICKLVVGRSNQREAVQMVELPVDQLKQLHTLVIRESVIKQTISDDLFNWFPRLVPDS